MKVKLLNAIIITTLLSTAKVIFAQTPNLGSTANFAFFTSVGAFTTEGATNVTGNIGTNSGALTGFPPGTIVGQLHVADPITVQAAADLNTAYNYLSALTCGGSNIGTSLGNDQRLTPNIYCLNAASTLDGNLTLDAQDNPNAVFIFKIQGALTTTTLSSVALINGASVDKVFWLMTGAYVQGTNSVFKGTIVSNGAISLLEGASLSGRALTRQGAIDLHNNNTLVVLPIDLVYFTAQKQENSVQLNWAAVSERHIVRYEIQRSYNARDFETLASFKSLGGANDKNVYSYLDKSPFDKVASTASNIIYYRVKQVDFNNIFDYSRIISVAKGETERISVYPNPSSYQIIVKSATSDQPFVITNTLGKTVSSGQYTATNALDISHLPAGFYNLNIQAMNIRFLKN